MSTRRGVVRRVAVIVLAVVVALMLVLPSFSPLLVAAGASPSRPVAAPVPPGAVVDEAPGPVLLVGFTGVRWDDVTALATPHLWQLGQHGAVANMVVRSVRSSACPADGWLAVSAGRRAADLPTEEYGTCRRLVEPGEDGQVPGWADYRAAAEEAPYDARPGMLGDLLVERGVSAAALGPGAAIALATGEGTFAGSEVLEYSWASRSPRLLRRQVAAQLDHQLVVVDAGAVRDRNRPLVTVPEREPADLAEATAEPEPEDPGTIPPRDAWLLAEPDRAAQVSAVDARLGAVLAAAAEHAPTATVVAASLADSGTQPLMQVVGVAGPDELALLAAPALEEDERPVSRETATGGALLATRSTRQDGIVQSTDLVPSLLALLGVDAPSGLPGAPFQVVPDAGSGPARVAGLQDENRHAVAIRPLVGPFYSALVLINLLLYAAVTVALNRRSLDRLSGWLEKVRGRRRATLARSLRNGSPATALRALRAVSVAVAAIPVASYLANLVPWWRTDSPGLVLYGTTALTSVGIAAVALLGPWRRQLLAPVAVVAGLTSVLLVWDVLTGASLQVSALMGVQPQVGGRFYGFNNSSFALHATAAVLLAVCLAEPLVRRGRRRVAAAVVALVGLVATVLNGAPAIGADFGGPPALIPAFALLALLTLGVRVTWARAAVVLGVTAVLALSFSVVDYLRPPAERSHLGRFVETVLDGGLADVVGRKLAQNVANLFGSTLTFLAIGGIVLVVVVLSRPLRDAARQTDGGVSYGWLAGGSSLSRLDRDTVMLRPGVAALAVALGIGFAVNDSGIVIPAIGISLAVPLLIAVVAGWLLTLRERSRPVPARSAPQPRG
ncbi:hypothetical protein PU560_11650 [Georgenia sp. 10Sc9-8]|uniref:Uncharacterized protein n=1 Tax=Georgenia halotolerans TaxID=3028317 RepID=A0ABT5TYF9_9MICO|nr:hypothetical protein [Georgenia halotolerans]